MLNNHVGNFNPDAVVTCACKSQILASSAWIIANEKGHVFQHAPALCIQCAEKRANGRKIIRLQEAASILQKQEERRQRNNVQRKGVVPLATAVRIARGKSSEDDRKEARRKVQAATWAIALTRASAREAQQ